MYTKETLAEVNGRFLGTHYCLHDSDVEKANKFVELIERTRSTTQPKPGDILHLTDKYGMYFPFAHIEKTTLGVGGNICEHAYVPFISEREDGISCSTSGGAWQDVDFADMKYVGKVKKKFCDWGHCGGCKDGAIEFEAEVSVWEYKDPNPYEPGYSTQFYEKYYVSDSGEDTKYTRESGYRWHVSRAGQGFGNCCAFKTKEDYDAWLKTFRGKVFKGNWHNQSIVWAWKEDKIHVTPEEFDAMPWAEDTMLFNGAVRKCKRYYDELDHRVTTAFVWYWDEPEREGETYSDRYTRQNKIREEKYTLPWNTPVYQLAREVAS